MALLLLTVVFMDEAGLPEESHESLKVIIIMQLYIIVFLLQLLIGTTLSPGS